MGTPTLGTFDIKLYKFDIWLKNLPIYLGNLQIYLGVARPVYVVEGSLTPTLSFIVKFIRLKIKYHNYSRFHMIWDGRGRSPPGHRLPNGREAPIPSSFAKIDQWSSASNFHKISFSCNLKSIAAWSMVENLFFFFSGSKQQLQLLHRKCS